jgi:hypothetical protein
MAFLVAKPQKQYRGMAFVLAAVLVDSRWAMPITCSSVMPG